MIELPSGGLGEMGVWVSMSVDKSSLRRKSYMRYAVESQDGIHRLHRFQDDPQISDICSGRAGEDQGIELVEEGVSVAAREKRLRI